MDGITSPAEVTSWHRPLEFYVGLCKDAGLCADRPSGATPNARAAPERPMVASQLPAATVPAARRPEAGLATSSASAWPSSPSCCPAWAAGLLGLCENFLYGFKAARRAARAANSARSPSLPLALPLRRRQRRSAGAKSTRLRAAVTYGSYQHAARGPVGRIWQLSGAGVLPIEVLSGPGRTRQGRL